MSKKVLVGYRWAQDLFERPPQNVLQCDGYFIAPHKPKDNKELRAMAEKALGKNANFAECRVFQGKPKKLLKAIKTVKKSR